MRDVLVLISFDTVQFITAIKVRAHHKIVSNIWNPCCVHTISQQSSNQDYCDQKKLKNALENVGK